MENRNPDGFYYSERRTVDSKRNVIANAHEEAVNVNDISPPPEIVKKPRDGLGRSPYIWAWTRDIPAHGEPIFWQ